MAFFGLSSTGKNAQGRLGELPNWYYDQMKQWLGQVPGYEAKGNALRDLSTQYWQDLQDQGFPGIGAIQGYGQEIMPGLDEMLARRQERLGQIMSGYQGLTPGATTAAGVNQNLDEQGNLINSTNADVQSEIDRAYGSQSGRAERTIQDLIRNTQGQYGAMRGNLANVYGGLRTDNANTFGNLLNQGEGTFSEALKNLEQLRPGSELAQARAARAFAPAIGAAAGRLRRMGIDPNSPQAQATLGRVEAARSRAIDDQAAGGTRDYVGQLNQLGLGRQALRNELGLGRLGAERGLALGQIGAETGLGQEEGGIYRGLTLGNLSEQQRLEGQRAAGTIGNAQDYQSLANDLANRRIQALLLGRNLGLEDWQRGADLQREQNQEELVGQDLRNTRYGMGQNYAGLNLNARNLATQQLGNIGSEQYQNMFNAGKMGGQFGQQAGQGYQTSLQNESANAGWGKKLLGGLAMAGLSMVPGGGVAAGLMRGLGQGAIGGLMGGGGGRAPQYGGFGGYGGGTFGGSIWNQKPTSQSGQQYNVAPMPNFAQFRFPVSVGR